jgi:hypothetical protein
LKSRQKIIDLEEQEIKSLEDDLAKQGPVLSAEAKKINRKHSNGR